jgi:hypothetical protein
MTIQHGWRKSSVTRRWRCITICHIACMAKAISVRLDDDAERALRTLEASGLTRSEAIRTSLLASADREEMAAVVELMEALRAPR